ncbi:MAG: PilW family protein, partial [Proteobacteria bacterium]|nr:PilW family protein [Pseudomonadota bacterium]
TLIEIMVVLVISGVIIAGIYQSFTTQNKSYLIQEQTVAMQQSLRAGFDMMAREIRMAGYDPTESGLYAITSAGATSMGFNCDLDGDGEIPGAGETFLYQLYDQDGDGTNDTLRRTPGGSALSEFVHAIGFAYAYDSDNDGVMDRSPNGNIIWAVDADGDGDWDRLDTNDDGTIDSADAPGAATNELITGVDTSTVIELDTIRAVKVWMLVMTEKPDRDFTNTFTYIVGNQKITSNDNFRRRLLSTTIKCRNTGL